MSLIGSAISVGAGLLGSIFGSSGANRTNRTNLQIARETNKANMQIAKEANEANYKLWQEQNQANIDMWNMENDYNTATNQRKRLEDAGLNPYLMMNGGSAGTAGSISSATPTPTVTPTMQGATLQNPVVTTPFDQAMQQVGQMLYNHSVQKEQIRSQQLDNDMKEIDLQFKPLMALYEKNSKKYQSFIDNVTFDYLNNTLQDRKNSVKYRTATDYQDFLLREEQVIGAQLDNTTKGLINYFLPAEKLQGLMQGVAQIQATESNIKKINAEIRNLVAIAFGKEVDNNIKVKTAEGLIKAINAKSNYDFLLNSGTVHGLNRAQIELHKGRKDLLAPIFNTIGFNGDAGFSIGGPKGTKGNQKKKKTKDSIEVGVGASGSQSRIDTYDPRNGWDYYLPLGSEFDDLF